MPVLYKLTIKDYYYWGRSERTLAVRRNEHYSRLRNGKGVNRFMQSVFDKYGADAFKMQVVIESDDWDNICFQEEERIKRDMFEDKCMNWAIGGGGGAKLLGRTQTPEHVEKRAAANRGSKRSEESKEKMKQSSLRRKDRGKPVTISKDGESLTFPNRKKAAGHIGVDVSNITRALNTGRETKGWAVISAMEV